jgi:predicted GIY-YIG superfamily endonuclease
MVHWVYVLECEDNIVYVGETINFDTRFIQHLTGNGGATTSKYKPCKLIGLYRVNENHAFMRYRNTVKSGEYNRFLLDNWDNSGDNLLIENHITERYLWERRNNHEYGSGNEWYRIRGGKYTYESLDGTLHYAKEACSRPNRVKGSYKCISSELSSLKEEEVVDRPLCKCGYPSEVKLSIDKSKIYFVCSLKNIGKSPFKFLQIPCDFYQQYTEDCIVKEKYENKCLIKLK